MPKRFVDTELDDQPWFMALSCRLKCVVQHVFRKCDNAGIWIPNYVIASSYIGESFTEEELLAIDDGAQFEKIEKGKIFVVGFCDFQYGKLSEDCHPHRAVIDKLIKYNLYLRVLEGYSKGTSTLQENTKNKTIQEEDKDERRSGGKQRKPNLRATKDSIQRELKKQYEELVPVVQAIQEPREQKIKLAEFITAHKPQFVDPYADLWNISVPVFQISPIDALSDTRVKKFKSRIREPSFDFLKILQAIKKSPYLQGKVNGWKVSWDWIFEDDVNYLKILEGNY
jgi:hypothetical protein